MKRLFVFLLPFFLGTFMGLHILAQSASAQSRDYTYLPSGPYLAENDDPEVIRIPMTVEYTAVYPDGRTEDVRTNGVMEMALASAIIIQGQILLVRFAYNNTSSLGGGPYTATNVVMTLYYGTLFTALAFAGASFFACETLSNSMQCTASSFPANQREEITAELQAQTPGTQTITASFTQNEFDPDTSNNSQSATVEVLPGKSISGTVVNDMDGDGTADSGDTPVTGICLYLDENKNGVQDDGEATATTDSDGNYEFPGVEDGDHDIRRCTSPASSYLTVQPDTHVRTVTVSGESVTGVDWFLSLPISLYLGKYEDMNGNGVQDSGDSGIAEWMGSITGQSRLFLPTNSSVTTSWQTGAEGTAEITGLLPNTGLVISETPQTGWSQSDPGTTEGTISLDLVSGQTYTRWFGNYRVPGLVSVNLINDLNENGALDGSDGRISGITYWIDNNLNFVLDDGETSATTDGDGVASLQPSSPGDVAICTAATNAVSPVSPSWSSGAWCQELSLRSGDAAQSVDFFGTVLGYLVTGTLIEDRDGDGVTDDGETGAADVCMYSDGDNDGVQDDGETSFTTDANGAFSHGPVPDGTQYIRLCESSGWYAASPDNGLATVDISGENVATPTWYVYRPISFDMTMWHDRNGNGTREEGDEGLEGWMTSVTGENPLFASYTNSSVTGALSTGASGVASYTNLRPNNLEFAFTSQTGWSQSYPADNGLLYYSIFSGDDVTVDGFGLWKQPGNVIIEFVNDLNENGQKDTNEGTLFGYLFFLDLNGNGVHDPNEPSSTTDQDGYAVLTPSYPGTYPACTTTTTVNPVSPANDDGGAWCVGVTTVSDGSPQIFTFFGSGPPVIVEGYKWIDLDGDGEEDDGEPRLNGVTINLLSGGTIMASAETADLDRDGDGSIDATTERGWYQFVISADGDYAIEEVVPDGMEQTSPAGGSHQVTITGLQSPAMAFPFSNFIPALDWGDLPDPREDLAADCPRGAPINCYRTLAGVQGAAHMISATGVRLGQRVDAETNGQPNADATGDDDNISSQGTEDDEDGLLNFIVDGTGKITLELDVSGTGFLDAYADVNDDGVLNDGVLSGLPNEAFFIAQPVVNGINILETPEGTVPPYADIKYIRLRVSSTGGLGAAGVALDGEVEDYRVSVQRPQTINSSDDAGDANPGDGICADADGNCSLRAAIEEANASGQPYRLDFPSGKSAVTVQPGSPLPAFEVPIWVQSGGQLTIDGSLAGMDANGLTVRAGGSFISGVTIHSFSGDGVAIESGDRSAVSSSTIYGNAGNGVTVLSGTGNRISETVIYDNGGLGIDLGDDGVTGNDVDDSDTGANGLFNYPELSLVTAENGRVEGSVLVAADGRVTIDLFSSAGCDASGNGEGETFLTTVQVTSVSGGDTSFTANLGDPLQIGQVITATATDEQGNTSEFSPCFVAVTTDIEREDAGQLPQQFTLDQNYPNPFNPVTKIQFSVAQTEHVRIEVFDMLGKRVAGLIDRVMEPGSYSVSFDAKDLPSGQYIYTMQAGRFQQTKTLTLLK